MEQYKGKFKVVHIRCVTSGIEDGLAFYHLLPGLLKPGGVCLIVHADFVHGEDRTLLVQDDVNAPVRNVPILSTNHPTNILTGFFLECQGNAYVLERREGVFNAPVCSHEF